MFKFKYHNNKYLAAIFLISLSVFLPSCWYFREKGLFLKKDLEIPLSGGQKDSAGIADSLKKSAINSNDAEGKQPDSSFNVNKEKNPERDTVTNYYIIIGSFTNPENARSAVKQYRNKGYNTSIINSTNSKGNKAELVSVATFNNPEDAVRYLRDFQSKANPKAWIYPKP